MNERPDEYEGGLGDPAAKEYNDRVAGRARRIMFDDLAELSEHQTFLRWIQRFIYPMLTQDVPVNNGSVLAEFMGRRKLLNEIQRELDEVAPGFLIRVLKAREKYEDDLRQAAQRET